MIKVTTLAENTASQAFGIIGEHGLSVLVERDGHKILFDTGQGFSIVHNADILGVKLQGIEKIVLSHGHYDHTGGLREVLRRTGEVEVIAHPDILEAKYAKRDRHPLRYIGIPFNISELESLGARFKFEKLPVRVAPGVITTGEIERKNSFEQVDSNLYVKRNGLLEKDRMLDDQALVIETGKGLIAVSYTHLTLPTKA